MSNSCTKNLNILHILGAPTFGGIEKIVIDLSKEQSKDPDLRVEVVFALNGGDEMLDQFEQVGVRFHQIALRSGFDFSPVKLIRLLNLLKKSDLVHMHFFNPFVALMAIFSKTKILYTEHGNFGFGRNKSIHERLKVALQKIFLNRFVGFVSFNSAFTEKTSNFKYGLKTVSSAIIGNGICIQWSDKPQIIDHEIVNMLKNKFVVGFVGRFAGVKRIDYLLAGFQEFQKKKSDALLLLVGDGPLCKEIIEQTSALAITDKTLNVGYQSNPQMFESKMDVCVLPSENEAFGLVAIECLALGKPVIVFADGGGLVEIISGICPDDVVNGNTDLVNRLEFYYYNRSEIASNLLKRLAYASKFDVIQMSKKFKKQYFLLN